MIPLKAPLDDRLFFLLDIVKESLSGGKELLILQPDQIPTRHLR